MMGEVRLDSGAVCKRKGGGVERLKEREERRGGRGGRELPRFLLSSCFGSVGVAAVGFWPENLGVGEGGGDPVFGVKAGNSYSFCFQFTLGFTIIVGINYLKLYLCL